MSFKYLSRLLFRLRYPLSMPQDIAHAIGIDIPQQIAFQKLLKTLVSNYPRNLVRYMPREQAERFFYHAPRKERFCSSSFFAFLFYQGWLEFELQFDERSRLRRVYLHHGKLKDPQEIILIEISTKCSA